MERIISIQQCPDCGKVISFANNESTVTQCILCGAVVRKKSNGELYTKPHWLVSKSNDSIKPGTTGMFEGKKFTVLGRIRAWFGESVFNYWTIAFPDDSIALLGEAYGIYGIFKKLNQSYISFQQLEGARAGVIKEIVNNEPFLLERKTRCEKWELEGESSIAHEYEKFEVFDLSSFSGNHLSIFFFTREHIVLYGVKYIDYSELALQNLRTVTHSAKEIECTNCHHTIVIKTYPYAQSCVCAHCHTGYGMQNGTDFAKRSIYTPKEAVRLPLGSKGMLKGISYEVIGYAEKEELNAFHSQWREYTLYNPNEGFAFLSEYDGHWIYVKESCNAPVLRNKDTKTISFNKEPFQLFNGYSYKIIGAAGEFPHNAFNNNNTTVREYISPPEMWIQEKDGKDSIIWFLGKHVNPSEISNVFDPCDALPVQNGVGAIQPKGYISTYKIVAATVMGIFALILLHLLIGAQSREKMLLNKRYDFADSTNNISIVTEKFHLDKYYANLLFKLSAPVDNSWVSANATLVNADNGKEYSIEKGVEFYHGYTEGEYWSEGLKDEEAYLTNIPEGNYFLQVAGLREADNMGSAKNMYLEVLYDVPSHRNLFFAILLLLIWPIAKIYTVGNTELRRWENSPYSKFNNER